MNNLLDDNTTPTLLNNNQDIAAANNLRININESIKAIRAGLLGILILIGFTMIGLIIGLSQNKVDPTYIYIEGGFMIMLYLVALIVSLKNNSVGLLTGLISYLLYIGLSTYLIPESIMKGILIKIIVIFLISKGLLHTQKLKEYIQKLKAIQLTAEDTRLIQKLKELPKIKYIKK
ncbi:MAG: hypothetical protein GY810_00070 [Aureispira sp.]|nr:hypothetical protein [Aureispira sp.]